MVAKIDFRKHDPFYPRESAQYDDPIPSREFLLQYCGERGKPLSLKKLQNAFELDEGQKENIEFRLKAMIRDGQLMQDRRGRFCLAEKVELVKGTVIAHADGYGFVKPHDAGSDDIFLSPKQMRIVLNGDEVAVRVTGIDRRGRLEGMILDVLAHNTQQCVGRLIEQRGVYFVEPENKRMPRSIIVAKDQINGAKPGQMVSVKLLTQPSQHKELMGMITEVLGDHMAPGMEIQVALRNYDLPYEWPAEVLTHLKDLPTDVSEADMEGRADLRDCPFVTIDGEDARDFDDAVYVRALPKGGWVLHVAIADVSHYVSPESALDHEAHTRGNSVYFPEQVIPMLPEALSNDLCSLNPHVDRLTMVCEMSVNAKGKISRSRFYSAVIHSSARLTYNKVAAMLVDNDSQLQAEYQHVFPHLEQLYDLYKALKASRVARGAIDFETTETKILFGEGRKIEKIVPATRNEAHKIIEECMLAANISTAQFLLKSGEPGIYRVHDIPHEERLNNLREFLRELNLDLKGKAKPKTRDFARVLSQIQERPDKHLIQMVMLRTMSQAVYSTENIGHFGLAYDAYTHFTSPIRRYPDLIVHRLIKHQLQHAGKTQLYAKKVIEEFASHCSMTERRADEAVRDVTDWLKCEYMLDHIGKVFPGIISTVTGFGIFVELTDIYVEGLVHVTELQNDYYKFDSAKHRLLGERTGKIYRVSDPVRVKVVRVNLDDRKIDFTLAGVDDA